MSTVAAIPENPSTTMEVDDINDKIQKEDNIEEDMKTDIPIEEDEENMLTGSQWEQNPEDQLREDETRADWRRRVKKQKVAQRRKFARSGKGAELKFNKTIATLGIPGEPIEVLDILRKEFKIEALYDDLPLWGPEKTDEMKKVLDRPEKYHNKMVGQETSLMQKLYQIGVGESDCVIDLGCGNGCFAITSTYVLGSSAIGVDMDTPTYDLCAETYIPKDIPNRFRRIERNIREPELFTELLETAKELGAKRFVIVCKHLCGTGTDLCIALLKKLQEDCELPLLGCVIATCCQNKLVNDLETYIDLYGPQPEHLEQISRWSTWKATAISSDSFISKQQITYAKAFEDCIQASRIRYLRGLFPYFQEVLFVPDTVTPHNRCMIGSIQPLREDLDWHTEGVPRALKELGSRWDVNPRNVSSKKYQYDAPQEEVKENQAPFRSKWEPKEEE